ncbi:Niemann-Pick C1 protein [Trichuris trichiura]|uniref:Niemann-Pick C1 protein n=1 Tax=Trichuris trichiura TaxID=36087 RepID=A0A077ZD92_TRITR|nr:Niemann-Pick C1 protein [Trichuris trichiura]
MTGSMCNRFVPLLVYLATIATAIDQDHCVWYKECIVDNIRKNCVYNGPPLPLKDLEALNTIIKMCPSLIEDHFKGSSKELSLCCDADQVRTLAMNMNIPQQYFSRCPSCLQNFVQLWCQLTCSPKQSSFLNVTGTVDAEGKAAVQEIQYHVTNTFVSGVFNSCRYVQDPSTNQRVMNIMCRGKCLTFHC